MIFQYNTSSIHYEIIGKGPTIILLHGFLESSAMWKEIAAEASKNKTLILIDLPGHGKSDSIGEIHTMELMANVVFSLLKHLQIEKVSIIGHSMGGYVALAFAEKYESHINSLVLLNSTSFADSSERIENRNRALKLIDTYKETFISMAISNLFTDEARTEHLSAITELKKEALTFPVAGIKAFIIGMRDRKDRTEIFRKFRNKKFIICGEQDPIVPFNISQKMAKQTNSTLSTLKGGHMSWLENKEEIVKILYLID